MAEDKYVSSVFCHEEAQKDTKMRRSAGYDGRVSGAFRTGTENLPAEHIPEKRRKFTSGFSVRPTRHALQHAVNVPAASCEELKEVFSLAPI